MCYFYSAPPAPYNITTSSINPSELVVKWDDRCATVNNAIGCFGSNVADVYIINYKTAGGTEQTETVEDGGNSNIAPPREKTLINLISNTEYIITIQIEGHGATEPNVYDIYSDVSSSETGITSELIFIILSD